jgi:hypothetical protein
MRATVAKKYAKRYLKPDGWNFKDNPLVGTEWSVAGSKKNSFYTVALTEQGFTCDCTGFTFYGKCKHSEQIVEAFDNEQDYLVA